MGKSLKLSPFDNLQIPDSSQKGYKKSEHNESEDPETIIRVVGRLDYFA